MNFLNFRHCQIPKFQNFKSIWTKPKFCGQLLKAPKAKAKVNKIHRKWTKAKYNTKNVFEILLISWNLINFHKISSFFIKLYKSLKYLGYILLKRLKNHHIIWILGFNEIFSRFVSFITKIFCFRQISQLLIYNSSMARIS